MTMLRIPSLILAIIVTLGSAHADEVKYYPKRLTSGAYQYINPETKESAFPMFFKSAGAYSGELAPVSFDGVNYAMMNRYGMLVTDFVFEGMPSNICNGVGILYKGNSKSVLVAVDGKELTEPMEGLDYKKGIIIARHPLSKKQVMVDGTCAPLGTEGLSDVKVSSMPLYVSEDDKESITTNFAYAKRNDMKEVWIDMDGNYVLPEILCEPQTLYMAASSYDLNKTRDKLKFNIYPLSHSLVVASPDRGAHFGVYLFDGTEVLPAKDKSANKAAETAMKQMKKVILPLWQNGTIQRVAREKAERLNAVHEARVKKNLEQLGATEYASFNSLEGPYYYVEHVTETVKSGTKATKGKNAKSAKTAGTRKVHRLKNSGTSTKYSNETFDDIIDVGIYHYCRKPGSKKYNLYNTYGFQVTVDGFDEIDMWGYNADGEPIFKVRDGKEWGLVNVLGYEILAPQFSDVGMTCDTENTVVAERDGMKYLLNGQTGRLINNVPYDKIGYERSDKTREVERLGYTTRVDRNGKETPSIATVAYDEAVNMPAGTAPADRARAYSKALSLCGPDDNKIKGYIYNNVGVIFYEAGDKARAKEYYTMGSKLGNSTAASNLNGLKQEERAARWEAISGALSAIGQGISAMGGDSAFTGFASGMTGGGGDLGMDMGNYGDTSGGRSGDPGAPSKFASEDFYRNNYKRWEDKAKDHYEALTRNGTRTSSNGKAVSGTAEGEWRHHYAGLKRLLRDDQKRMRETRQEARRAGFTIQQSNYETVTVTNY